MRSALLIVLGCILGVSVGHNDDPIEVTKSGDYMVCKPVAGVYGVSNPGKKENKEKKGIMPVIQGPEGPPGPPGLTGSPGPRGKPDYSKVKAMIDVKLKLLKTRMYQMEKDIETLRGGVSTKPGGSSANATEEDEKRAKACFDKFDSPFNVGDLCYNIIGKDGSQWSYATAESRCKLQKGMLADVNSRKLYDKLYDYVDSTYNEVVQAWTGLRYEDDKLLLRDGNMTSFAKWSSGYPRKSTVSYYSGYTKVYMYIDTASAVRKLYNSRSSIQKPYAICSYELTPTTA